MKHTLKKLKELINEIGSVQAVISPKCICLRFILVQKIKVLHRLD